MDSFINLECIELSPIQTFSTAKLKTVDAYRMKNKYKSYIRLNFIIKIDNIRPVYICTEDTKDEPAEQMLAKVYVNGIDNNEFFISQEYYNILLISLGIAPYQVDIVEMKI